MTTDTKQPPDTVKRGKTNRGFALGEFNDYNGQKCTIQKSSLADADCIWLGVDDANPKIMASDAARLGLPTDGQGTGWVPYRIPEEVLLSTRMHINADMARALVAEIAAIFGDEEWAEVVSGESEGHAWVVANETANERDALGREIDAIRSQVTALTEERDELKTLTDELGTTSAGRWRALAVEERARADRAEKERDTLNECNAANILEIHRADRLVGELRADLERARALHATTTSERDRAIAERDDLGCQLEALRAVQRGDVADLRTRMEAMERWRVEAMREIRR